MREGAWSTRGRGRRQQAELIAVGIGQGDPPAVSLGTVEACRPDSQEPLDLGLEILAAQGGEVDFSQFLPSLRFSGGAGGGSPACAARGRSSSLRRWPHVSTAVFVGGSAWAWALWRMGLED